MARDGAELHVDSLDWAVNASDDMCFIYKGHNFENEGKNGIDA